MKNKKTIKMNKMLFLILKGMNGSYQNINLKFVFILINIVFQNINWKQLSLFGLNERIN